MLNNLSNFTQLGSGVVKTQPPRVYVTLVFMLLMTVLCVEVTFSVC